jgi:hypothetical protein
LIVFFSSASVALINSAFNTQLVSWPMTSHDFCHHYQLLNNKSLTASAPTV